MSLPHLWYGLLLAQTAQTKAECLSKCTQRICPMSYQVERALTCIWQLADCKMDPEQVSPPIHHLSSGAGNRAAFVQLTVACYACAVHGMGHLLPPLH